MFRACNSGLRDSDDPRQEVRRDRSAGFGAEVLVPSSSP